jgi:hypothetical protein
MLTFLSESPQRTKDGHIQWICQCDCGDVYKYIATRVKHKRVNQCKQCVSQLSKTNNAKHGMKYTGTYSTWASMKDRCLNKNSNDFENYGAKGISICKEWINSFEMFYLDMGEKPKNMSIDRINNTLGYFKENCRWATHSQQQRNKSNSCLWLINGVVYESLLDAATEFGVTKQTIIKWVDGWTDKRRNKIWSPKDGCKRIQRY